MLSKTTQKVYARNLQTQGNWVKYLAKGTTSVMWEPKKAPALDVLETPANGRFVKCIDAESLKVVFENRKQDMWVLKLGRFTLLRESH